MESTMLKSQAGSPAVPDVDTAEILSKINIYNKYAKYKRDLLRRENWNEIINRNETMHINRFQETHPELVDAIMDAHVLARQKKILPSMRSLQFAGKPIELSPNRIYNCFSEDTEFVTSKGVFSFKDFKDGDEILVPTHKDTQKAIVKSYGIQELNEVTFVRGKSKKIIKVTDNHRWILYDGTETTNLKEGDILYPTKYSSMIDRAPNFVWENATPEEKLYWCYGFVYGDGTLLKNKNGDYTHSMVRLCGDKNKYLYRFEEMGFSSSTNFDLKGDNFVYTGKYLKTLPEINGFAVTGLIRAFLFGYLSADGYYNPDWYKNTNLSKYKSIQTSNKEAYNWLKSALPFCGFYITNEKNLTGEETNYGIRGFTMRISFTNKIGSNKNTAWIVKDIQKNVSKENVWCLEVENDKSFVLPSGIVTGNCAYCPIDHPKVFGEIMFLLLGGTGVGFSVQHHHIEELPEINKPTKTKRFLIGDSIEGWAEAVNVLMKSYFKGTPKPLFDYRDIRPKGAALITSGGKAPGPGPLMICLAKIEAMLEELHSGEQLTSLQVHDIVCHIADAVLAGGIRRAALISLFSFDDVDMRTAKYNSWWEHDPQRGRANNSAVILRSKVTEPEFKEFWKSIELSGAGEPGIFFTNDKDVGTNPSLRKGTKVLTDKGIFSIEDLETKIFNVVNLQGNKSSAQCFLSGKNKELFRIELENGVVYYSTAEHKWPVVDRNEGVIKKETTDLLAGDLLPVTKIDTLFDESHGEGSYYDGYLVGHVYGDGWFTYSKSEEKNQIGILCNQDDYAGKPSAIIMNRLQELGCNSNFKPSTKGNCYEINTTHNNLVSYFTDRGLWGKEKGLPDDFLSRYSEEFIKGFIDGIFTTDGSIDKTAIVLKSSRYNLIKDISEILGFYGIRNFIHKKTQKNVSFPNGKNYDREYTVYTLKISDIDSQKHFAKIFSLSGKKKQYALNNMIARKLKKKVAWSMQGYKILSVTKTDLKEDVWDITVYDDTHTFKLNHVVTGNCGEISLKPYQFCNLVEVNTSTVTSQEDLNERVRHASFLATIQSSYTDFHFLRSVWQRQTEKEYLIGVGLTGIADGEVLKYDLKEATEIVKAENERVADIIGIKPAYRCTTVKPSGNSSVVLGTSSGIHARHNPYYWRRIKIGKNEPLYNYMAKIAPMMVEDDQRNPNMAFIKIAIKSPDGAIYRNENPLNFLERVKHVFENWVKNGHRKGVNYNNVSATCYVKEDEWDEVGKWCWDNKDNYSGISFLPYDGGTYIQTPYEDCTKEDYLSFVESIRGININMDDVIEEDDNTDLKGEIACSSGNCDIEL
jgi:hypothetical protein